MSFENSSIQGWTLFRQTVFTVLMILTISINTEIRAESDSYSEGTSKIIGKVADAETGEAIIGATIMVENTTLGAFSDLDGNFIIKKVPFGYYAIKVSSIGYKTSTVSSVVVTADQNTSFNILLKPEITEVEGITVSAKAVNNTSATVLLKRKNANNITDAISAEEISRSGSSNAAEAMTKITGASVVGGKYVYVRGLGDRYANTKLNGSTLPSPDPDKQAVPMDLVPTALLDNIVVEKTFTPDKSGDFAGGSINLGTKDYPEKRTLKLSISSGYDSKSTFNDMLSQEGSSTDWVGYDDGLRDIPDYITSNEELQQQVPEGAPLIRHTSGVTDYDSVAALAAYIDSSSRSFSQDIKSVEKQVPLNQGYGISYGDQFSIFDRPLGIVGSFNYSRKYDSYSDGFSGKYKLSGSASDSLSVDHELNDIKGVDEVLWGGLLTLKYGLHRNHKIGFSFMRNQNGESTDRYLEGFFPEHVDPDELVITRAKSYAERSLQSIQFNGEHIIAGKNTRLEWQASFSDTKQEEPDIRFFTDQLSPIYVEDEDSGDLVPTGEYQHVISPNRFPVPERAWRKLDETNSEYRLDLTIPMGRRNKIKIGGLLQQAERTHSQRNFEYIASGGFDGDPDNYAATVGLNRVDTSYYAHDGIVDTTIFWFFDNVLTENVEARNQYTGDKEIFAAYGLIEYSLTTRINMVTGLRYEKTHLYSISQDDRYDPGELDNKDVLPSLNLIYKAGTDMNFRLSYGRTLARPTFREISPAATEEFGISRIYQGNPNLKRTLIDNVDTRWEWYIRPGEILAVSGFYKKFKNPIELSIVGTNGDIVPLNVDEGEVLGAEIEFRRNLSHISPFLDKFTLGGNFTIVKSIVDIPQSEQINDFRDDIQTTRPLVGQSPYLLNLDFSYNNHYKGTTVSLYYNLFGRRLAFNATGSTPDVYEVPRHQLDFLASQRIFGGPVLKLTVKNILGQNSKFVHEDIGIDAQNSGMEYIYKGHEEGVKVSLGVSYQIW